MVVTHRYTLRVPQGHSAEQVAASLSASLDWPCVGLSIRRLQQKSLKHFVQVMVGSSKPAPQIELCYAGLLCQLTLVQGVGVPRVQPTTFMAPSSSSSPMPVSLPDLVTERVTQDVATASRALDSKFAELQRTLEIAQTAALRDLSASTTAQIQPLVQRVEDVAKDVRGRLETHETKVNEQLSGLEKRTQEEFVKVRTEAKDQADSFQKSLTEVTTGFQSELR
eukprot:6469071-Amphidinium_carterae.1